LGAPANFNRFRVLAPLLQRRRSPEANQTARSLAVSWASTLYIIYIYIHFWGLLLPNGILLHAKFTLRPSLAFSYIGSVTARHSSSGPPPNFLACYKEWNYGTYTESAPPIFGWATITLCIGPHSSFDLKLWFCRRIITSDQSNLTKGRVAVAPHINGSFVFAVWRQCTPHLMTCFLGPTQVHTPNGIWIGSASFCKAHGRRSLYCSGLPLSPSKLLLSIVDLGPA